MSDKKVYKGKKGTKISYPTRRRSNVSKRRPLNRFEAEEDSLGVSASAKKLKNDHDDLDVKCEFGYRIINFFAVFSAISQHVKCKTCNSDIKFDETSPRGLGFKITISCLNCPKVSIPSSPFIRNAYDINRRMVLTMRILGVGLSGIKKFCAFMELPRPIFQSFYDKIVDTISIATATVRESSMKKAAEDEKKKSEENGVNTGITVSGDIAVCNFNDGLTNILRIMNVMDMDIGPQSYNFCLEADAARIKQAEVSLSDAAKEARSGLKSAKKESEEEDFNREGELYGPGIAD